MSQSNVPCKCAHDGAPKLVVLTGGPGAGKTAVLETVSREFCHHVRVLPEAASLLFGGGFPRDSTAVVRAAAQRAIFHVQRELEAIAIHARQYAVVLCDRGALDGLAYWPYEEAEFFAQLGTSKEAELARYATVIHLRSPEATNGYNRRNPVRIESAEEASIIDRRIEHVWADHPNRKIVESQADFVTKLTRTLELIRAEIPSCCTHATTSST